MALSRRDFVKLCSGTVAGFGVSQMFHPAIHEAFAQTLTGERPPVFWVQGQGCTGCSVTLLNSTHPSIADVLLKIISLEFHPTVMAAEGEGAYEHMMRVAEKFKGKFIFAVEGAVPGASSRFMENGNSPRKSVCAIRINDVLHITGSIPT